MKQLVVAGAGFLLGDDAADTVVDYATVLTRLSSADAIELRARTVDGRDTTVYFVLNSATSVLALSVADDGSEPDNRAPVSYMRQAIERIDPSTESYLWGPESADE
ncbi:MAG: hypothetical protein ACTHON_12490 [Humibacter sp.]